MPERFDCTSLAKKALYKYSSSLPLKITGTSQRRRMMLSEGRVFRFCLKVFITTPTNFRRTELVTNRSISWGSEHREQNYAVRLTSLRWIAGLSQSTWTINPCPKIPGRLSTLQKSLKSSTHITSYNNVQESTRLLR